MKRGSHPLIRTYLPRAEPIFYRVAASLLTFSNEIQVSGPDTSGEVEFVLISNPEGLRVAVGSDHTDRKAETIGVSLSKQLCAKPVSAESWRYDEVKPHWERLEGLVARGHRAIQRFTHEEVRELANDLCLKTDGRMQKEDLDAIIQWSLKVREMYLDIVEGKNNPVKREGNRER